MEETQCGIISAVTHIPGQPWATIEFEDSTHINVRAQSLVHALVFMFGGVNTAVGEIIEYGVRDGRVVWLSQDNVEALV